MSNQSINEHDFVGNDAAPYFGIRDDVPHEHGQLNPASRYACVVLRNLRRGAPRVGASGYRSCSASSSASSQCLRHLSLHIPKRSVNLRCSCSYNTEVSCAAFTAAEKFPRGAEQLIFLRHTTVLFQHCVDWSRVVCNVGHETCSRTLYIVPVNSFPGDQGV